MTTTFVHYAWNMVARSRSGGKGLFAALDDDGKSIGWTRGGGGGNGRRVILSMKTAHRQMYWEVGCAGNGKSLRFLAFIGTHVSVARPYPHDSLFCVKSQVLATKAELLKGGLCAECIRSKNISSPSKHKHKHAVVGDAMRGLRIRVWKMA
ncbi:hypothetical protein EV421DRAFT_1744713 [Armillaria borealis]|uniref:Uncharacterized protein n=1 Tax=Armillaria borealis TaxID=47425 RepID=A0AA39IT12_9AGAR|nr:hypothetical protein EV421DRAFT_1744713 [Armillaria borealis]